MLKKSLIKILYSILMFCYYFNKKVLKNNKNFNRKIIKLNNSFALYRIKNLKNLKILLLLPHCVQNASCNIRVSNDLNNCIRCGKCNVGELNDLKKIIKNLDIKIATGGTVARSYIKEVKPKLVVAVACERDLLSGIFDASPLPVYGVLNKILLKECIGTDFDIQEIKNLLLMISSVKEEK